MKLELNISEKVVSVDEFLQSIKREDSRFVVRNRSEEKSTLHLRAKIFDFEGNYRSSAVYYVHGVVDKSVINTLSPSIKVEPSLLFWLIQILLITSHSIRFLTSVKNFDLAELVFTSISLAVFIGFNYFIYRIGAAMFHGRLQDEIGF